MLRMSDEKTVSTARSRLWEVGEDMGLRGTSQMIAEATKVFDSKGGTHRDE